MTRTITTADLLDALPVKAVLLDEGGWPVWRDPHEGWCASNGTHDIPADLLIADGAPLTILHDPSAPAPAPSVVPEAAVDAVARALADDWNPDRDPVVTAMFRDYARTAITAAFPLLTAAPSVVSDAAGLGDRIAALSARLAAVGFPACTCHPGDDDSERCLPSPQDWRAEIERAALSSTTLTAAPSVTRDEVARAIRSVTDRWYEPLDEVHDVPPIADAILARFTITPKEDR